MPPKPKSLQSYFTTKPATSTWPLHTAFKTTRGGQAIRVQTEYRIGAKLSVLLPNCLGEKFSVL